ncbi:hypothetical protein MKW92_036949 [Papaver armeniacum]|nr:hypothetical protein MKW92_036949 [Papaver armeniacum]
MNEKYLNSCALQLQEICQECGESDDMGAEILIPFKMCKPHAKHHCGYLNDALFHQDL